MPAGIGQTHIEEVKHPVKILLPGRDRIFVALNVECAGQYIPVVLLVDPSLDISHGPMIRIFVNGLSSVRISCSSHVVSFSIAFCTGSLSPSDLLCNPLARASHTSAQDRPRSTTLSLLSIVFYVNVNRKPAVEECEGTYLNSRQKNTGRCQGDLSWRNTAGVLGHTQSLDESI